MKRLLALFTAAIDEWAASLRTSVTRIEAAAGSEFEQKLRYVTTSEAERQEIRESAILLAQLGVRREEIEPAIRAVLKLTREEPQ